MEIFPQNLNPRYHIELVRRRSSKGVSVPRVDDPLPRPDLGKMGRFWAKGMELTEEQAALAAPAAAVGAKSYAALSMMLGGAFAIILGLIAGDAVHSSLAGFSAFGAGMTGLWFLGHGPVAQLIFQKSHAALTPREVEDLIERAPDDLTRAYLQLVRDAVLVPTSDETAKSVRAALGALGDALEALPAVVIEPQDAGALRDKSRSLAERAAAESDPVIAASLQRQAESVEQRAESQEKSALVARRAATLRDEIFAKIASLRDAIAAQQTGALDATALAALSESARSVARESQAAAGAADELERYLAPGEAPVVQSIRR